MPRTRIVGVEVSFRAFLTSILDGSEWSYSSSGRSIPGTH